MVRVGEEIATSGLSGERMKEMKEWNYELGEVDVGEQSETEIVDRSKRTISETFLQTSR